MTSAITIDSSQEDGVRQIGGLDLDLTGDIMLKEHPNSHLKMLPSKSSFLLEGKPFNANDISGIPHYEDFGIGSKNNSNKFINTLNLANVLGSNPVIELGLIQSPLLKKNQIDNLKLSNSPKVPSILLSGGPFEYKNFNEPVENKITLDPFSPRNLSSIVLKNPFTKTNTLQDIESKNNIFQGEFVCLLIG